MITQYDMNLSSQTDQPDSRNPMPPLFQRAMGRARSIPKRRPSTTH